MSKISPTGTGMADGKGLVSTAKLLTRRSEVNLAFMIIEYHDVHDIVKKFFASWLFQIPNKRSNVL
jgi:hypothetical protein